MVVQLIIIKNYFNFRLGNFQLIPWTPLGVKEWRLENSGWNN